MTKNKQPKETTKQPSKPERPEFPEDRIEKGGWVNRNKQNKNEGLKK